MNKILISKTCKTYTLCLACIILTFSTLNKVGITVLNYTIQQTILSSHSTQTHPAEVSRFPLFLDYNDYIELTKYRSKLILDEYQKVSDNPLKVQMLENELNESLETLTLSTNTIFSFKSLINTSLIWFAFTVISVLTIKGCLLTYRLIWKWLPSNSKAPKTVKISPITTFLFIFATRQILQML